MGRSTDLSYEITNPDVLPETLVIVDEMIRLYNDWETSVYLKIDGARAGKDVTSQSPSTARYIPYSKKEELYKAIEASIPVGCKLVKN